MKLLYTLLKKIFYKNKIIIPRPEDIKNITETESYVCEVSFKLTNENNIDIVFVTKEVKDDIVEDISQLAENAANLIVLINNGLMKKELLRVIKDLKKINMNNDKKTLLLDNILFFHNLLQEEFKSSKKDSGPLIKPSSVFKSI
jgi:vacuolar-type H+-ATPase subunit F/Vma7